MAFSGSGNSWMIRLPDNRFLDDRFSDREGYSHITDPDQRHSFNYSWL